MDAGTGLLDLSLMVASGTLTLGSTAGLTVSGNGTNTVSLTGTLAQLNAALDGLVFRPAASVTGQVPLTIAASDRGNTPAPEQSASRQVTITVTPASGGPTEITNQVRTERSGWYVSRRTGLWTQDLTVTNISAETLQGGFLVRLQNLSSGATLTAARLTVGATTYTLEVDNTDARNPVIRIPRSLIQALQAGASFRLSLDFTNPLRGLIDYGAQVFSDPGL